MSLRVATVSGERAARATAAGLAEDGVDMRQPADSWTMLEEAFVEQIDDNLPAWEASLRRWFALAGQVALLGVVQYAARRTAVAPAHWILMGVQGLMLLTLVWSITFRLQVLLTAFVVGIFRAGRFLGLPESPQLLPMVRLVLFFGLTVTVAYFLNLTVTATVAALTMT